MRTIFQCVDDPEPENSPHLTEVEVAQASIVDSMADFIQHLRDQLGGYTVQKHEKLQYEGNLYWRVTLQAQDQPDKALVYQANWLRSSP